MQAASTCRLGIAGSQIAVCVYMADCYNLRFRAFCEVLVHHFTVQPFTQIANLRVGRACVLKLSMQSACVPQKQVRDSGM